MVGWFVIGLGGFLVLSCVLGLLGQFWWVLGSCWLVFGLELLVSFEFLLFWICVVVTWVLQLRYGSTMLVFLLVVVVWMFVVFYVGW